MAVRSAAAVHVAGVEQRANLAQRGRGGDVRGAGDAALLTLVRWAGLAGEHRRDRRDAGSPRSSVADLVLVARGVAIATPRGA